jgi:hypothetical protein
MPRQENFVTLFPRDPRAASSLGALLGDKESRGRMATLGALALLCVLLWQTEWGSFVLYPFTLLATWFHEMGHGLAAILTGGSFEQLSIYADGSGEAQSLQSADASVFSDALISAAGPLGPPLAGALLITATRSRRATRVALGTLAAVLVLSTLIWVRSLAGWIVLPAIAVALLAILWRGSPKVQDFAVQLLGVQACISTWQDTGYLFSEGGMVGGQLQRSDTAAIADSLLLPYWFWGAAISVLIVVLLAVSLRFALKR